MEFNIPTSKPQMYEILSQLFNYYRVKREGYESVEFKPLELARLSFNFPSEQEILEKARIYVAPSQEKEIAKYKQDLQFKKTELEVKLTNLTSERENLISNVEALYEKSVDKLEKQAVKNGLVSSGVLGEKIAQLESEKNEKIFDIRKEFGEKKSSLNAQISAYAQAIDNAEIYFSTAHQKEVLEQAQKLIVDYQKIEREVEKYNNSQDEKEQRYDNTILQLNATLKVRFLDVTSGELSKDTLIEMGYYADVIDCVCGYYNTLPPMQAFQDFNSDTKLPIYLDDYYQEILHMYAAKAGY